MERRHEPHAPALEPTAVVAGDEDLLVERPAAGDLAEQRHDLGLNQRDLLPKVREARLRLRRLRVAVSRRAALDDVGDIDVGPLEPDRVDHPRQKLAGSSDERPREPVLLRAGALADEHQIGVGIALARHGIQSAPTQPASFTVPDFGKQRRPRGVHRHPPLQK